MGRACAVNCTTGAALFFLGFCLVPETDNDEGTLLLTPLSTKVTVAPWFVGIWSRFRSSRSISQILSRAIDCKNAQLGGGRRNYGGPCKHPQKRFHHQTP